MSTDYIESLFQVIDGKINYGNVGKKKRGRKPGYKHSDATKEKIADQMRDRVKTDAVKQKISQSLQGVPKPSSTRRKISKSKKGNNLSPNSIADDLLGVYAGYRKEKDVPTSTAEFLSKCKYNKLEVCQWIKDNFKEFNKSEYNEYENEDGTIQSESRLKDGFYKGSPLDTDLTNNYEDF